MKRMNSGLALVLLVALLTATLSGIIIGCAGKANDTMVNPSWIEARIGNGSVGVPLAAIDEAKMIHFRVFEQAQDMVFMAYQFDSQIHVRAAICPPCRSEGFSLSGSTLVCDTCGTRFEASSGAGISGACKAYPKANVGGTISEGEYIVTTADLVASYQNTKVQGWP